jgi:clan AA aspartic protease
MIRGRVDDWREARVPLEIRAGDGEFQSIVGVVDTGFTGDLALPPGVIRCLALAPSAPTGVTLAGGKRELWNTWSGQVLWHDKLRTIRILEAGGTPLLGMELLQDSQLVVQIRVGGEVVIEELDGIES